MFFRTSSQGSRNDEERRLLPDADFMIKMGNYTNTFLNFVAIGAGIPAVALVLGKPEMVCQGLGSPPETWSKSPQATFGLYMYTVTDIVLAGTCAASSIFGVLSPTISLSAVAIHQYSYLAASIPAFGFKKDLWPSIVVGAIAGMMAMGSIEP